MTEEAGAPTSLYCREEGKGPTVLLLHGIGGNHTVWNGILPALAAEFRVLAPDLRGHGRSPAPPDSHFTFRELEGDLRRLLEERAAGPVHVVGLSGGALLALRFVLDRPEDAKSLVMVSGAAYTDSHTRAVADRWSEIYGKEGPDAFAVRLLKDLYYPDWIEAHLDFADALREQVGHQDFAPAVRWARAMKAFDERARIANLGRPTLIVQAMDDAVVDASHGRILRQSIPGAQIRIFAQTGHMIPVERPTETTEAIRSWVERAEPAPRVPSAGAGGTGPS